MNYSSLHTWWLVILYFFGWHFQRFNPAFKGCMWGLKTLLCGRDPLSRSRILQGHYLSPPSSRKISIVTYVKAYLSVQCLANAQQNSSKGPNWGPNYFQKHFNSKVRSIWFTHPICVMEKYWKKWKTFIHAQIEQY